MYIGVTSNLKRRVFEHKSRAVDGFTKTYNVHKLVYYECISDMICAIKREKQIKRWSREKKNRLVESKNPEWLELEI